jgi:hypothetical protein
MVFAILFKQLLLQMGTHIGGIDGLHVNLSMISASVSFSACKDTPF